MKSFLRVLKKIGSTVAGIIPLGSAILTIAAPAAGAVLAGPLNSLAAHIQSAIIESEQQFVEPGSGALKAQAVADNFNAWLAVSQDAAKAAGMLLTYDAAALDRAITAQVAAYNAQADALDAYGDLKDSIKLISLASGSAQ